MLLSTDSSAYNALSLNVSRVIIPIAHVKLPSATSLKE